MSISTGEWMPRTALLRAVPSNSTTEPPLANNKGADFIRLKSVAPPPSHFLGKRESFVISQRYSLFLAWE